MSPQDIIRAWKDEDYRLSLGQAERERMPQHPAGLIELTDLELDAAAGGLPGEGNTYFTYCSKGQHCINSAAGAWTC
jgi:mersacidin/lichenicidin family type 2 lantibiotic